MGGPDAWQVMDDWCLERARRLRERANPHVEKGGSLDDPEFRRLFGQHQAFLAMRSFIHGTRNAGEAGTAETVKQGSVHEHAVGNADAPKN